MSQLLDELYLKSKNVGFDSMISQLDAITKEDITKYQKLGYTGLFMKSEFENYFSINPKYIFYIPSIVPTMIYFNTETMAIVEIPILLFLPENINKSGKSLFEIEDFIDKAEDEAKRGDFFRLTSSLPDAMRLDYLRRLIENGTRVNDIYKLFFDIYQTSDFGFSAVDSAFIDSVLSHKTKEEINNTNDRLKTLPEEITVYRGGNNLSLPCDTAYSWTLDINIATFFATRMGEGPAYIAQGIIKKNEIIEYMDTAEQEIIVCPENIHIQNIIELKGLNFLTTAIPRTSAIFALYKEKLNDLDFACSLEHHDKLHSLRVLLLSIFLCKELQLNSEDRQVIYTTAIYHDSQRVEDCDDIEHGKRASDYYSENTLDPNPIVKFLCEYHCLPDAIGYQEIENNPELNFQADRVKLLYNLFKDADALDRIRFGWLHDELDMTQLRLDVSKTYPLVASICYQNLKL